MNIGNNIITELICERDDTERACPGSNISTIFIENLQYYMDKAKISQSTLADNLGVQSSTISMWKSGKSLPRLELLEKIALYLNVDASDLLRGVNKGNRTSFSPAILNISISIDSLTSKQLTIITNLLKELEVTD